MRSLTLKVARIETTSRLCVGRGLVGQLPTILESRRYSSIAIVADRGAEPHAQVVREALGLPSSALLLIAGGEQIKSAVGLQAIWQFLSDSKLDRRSLVVTLGGGATSDLVGFASATYMRGIEFVHVPTTLLAQVDASIGGKTGINFNGVKNLLGVVSQPSQVVIDIDVLSTLPARELRSGFAEVVKHGLIADKGYFAQVTSKPYDSWSFDELVDIVFRSCEIKHRIVESDETEQGARKTLNFGHTIGHAVEEYALQDKIALTHGEAVAIGMVAEALIAHLTGKLSEQQYERCCAGIAAAGLPTTLPIEFDEARIRSLMARDKKNIGGEIRWSLIDAIGSSIFDQTAPADVVTTALRRIQPHGDGARTF
jgi:3-dehydroquinate synthase